VGKGIREEKEGIDAKEDPARRFLNSTQPLMNSEITHTFVFDRHFA